LVGFLRFGVADVKDEVYLGYVLMFLNARGYPWDDPSETPEQQRLRRTMGLKKEQSVSGFSDREAHAIRLWLEAVRESGVFCDDDYESKNLRYALIYWRCRERPDWMDERLELLRAAYNDIGSEPLSDVINAGSTVLVRANWEASGGCQPDLVRLTVPATENPAVDSECNSGDAITVWARWEGRNGCRP
jgi:hypothetical protein